MAASTRRGSGFSRGMSTGELVEWLAKRGVAEKDRGALNDEGFTGESFLLLDSDSIKELGVRMSGRLQLNKLVKEASFSPEDEDHGLNEGRVMVVPPASTLITNDLRESSTTVGAGTVDTQEMRESPEPSTKQQGEEDVTRESESPVSQAQASGDVVGHLPSSVPRFHRELSTSDLVEWLQSRGLSREDSTIIHGEGFTGKSFLLMSRSDVERLPVSAPGRTLLGRLVTEATSNATSTALPPSNQDDEDVTREDEIPVYCTQGLESATSVFSFDHAVHMYRNKIWAGRELLKVNFLNPAVLEGWGLTVDVVLDWAKAWDTGVEKVPKFKQVASATRADIRVLLSGTQGCSSMIGMDAEKVRSVAEPTIVLNLRGLPLSFQRSLVIHEFGHALGLDHEHQRSDFWDVVGGHFERGHIPPTQASRVLKKLDSIDFDQVLEYDPHSIMHYWFDIDWLKNHRHRIKDQVEADNTLSADEKRYLLGVHTRQGPDTLPRQPSETDLRFLERTYEGANQCYMFPGRRERKSLSTTLDS